MRETMTETEASGQEREAKGLRWVAGWGLGTLARIFPDLGSWDMWAGGEWLLCPLW